MESPSSDKQVELSVELLRLASSKIRELEIEASPQNYTVWYAYFSGNDSSLKVELDQLLSNKTAFDTELCSRLYKSYFGDEAYSTLNKLRSSIKALISQLSDQVKGLHGTIGAYESSLIRGESDLSNDPDVKMLADIIQRLLAETRAQKRLASEAVQQIDDLNGEIDFLKQSLDQLNEEVYIDGLTGIANRKAYDNELLKELTKSRKYDRPMCLVVLDIDHFKRFNDTFGHTIGDRVLRFVAAKITANIKGQDFVARYGGEEFVMIFPNTDIDGAKAITRNILGKIAKAKLKVNKEGQKVGAVTLSAGVAVLNDEDTVGTLFERADKCLLQAKSSGRNNVVIEPGK